MSTYLIPMRPMSKPRPRMIGNFGGFRHNEAYTTWQYAMRAAIVERYGIPEPIAGPFRVEMVFRFPTRGRGDIDNLAGGVLDALQPPGASGRQGPPELYPGVLWVDDRALVELSARWEPSRDEVIALTVEPVEVAKLPPKRRRAG